MVRNYLVVSKAATLCIPETAQTVQTKNSSSINQGMPVIHNWQIMYKGTRSIIYNNEKLETTYKSKIGKNYMRHPYGGMLCNL